MPYIQSIKTGNKCVFCEEVLGEGVEPDLVIHRGRHAFVVMNLYPYTTGHLLVVPYRHVATLSGLEREEADELTVLLQRAERVLETGLGMRRHHVGINLGRCAGAGVEGHLHVHLVPRPPQSADLPAGAPEADAPLPLMETRALLTRAWNRPAAHNRTS
jgi:ATP adenylyltransferase